MKNYQEFETIDQLVLCVNTSFETKEDKARAFFTWISLNIIFDLEDYYSIRAPEFYVTFESEYTNRSISKQRRQLLAQRVFKERKGLCIGLSTLYQELCLRSDIEAEIVEGIIKISANDIKNSRYIKNHAWNAVKIHNQWHLIDLSFSSGYENSKTGQWETQFNDFYFFTNPEKLLLTHFPADSKYQLVEDNITIESFFNQPIFYTKYFASGIEVSDQQSGSLNVSKTDKKVRIAFKDSKQLGTIYYKFNNEKHTKALDIKKNDLNSYVADLKCRSSKADVLSLYFENEKILDFKIEK